jgi:diguanylate cyclase
MASGSSDISNNSKQSSDISESIKCLRLAVAKIQELMIPASPEVYSIWYEYYAGQKTDLIAAIDRRISRNGTVNHQFCQELFDQYFVEVPEHKLKEIRQAIRSLIDLLKDELSVLNNDLSSFSSVLESAESNLAEDLEIQSLQSIVHSLIDETKKCRSRNHKALSKVYRLNSQICSLQDTLGQLSEEVYQDSLTGIGNRRGFDKKLAEAIEDSRATCRPLSLILLDIDLFKRVNDEHGHMVGDRVLRFVSETLKRSVKGGDYVARYGGEEFALILPDTDLTGSLAVAQQVQINVARTKLTKTKGGSPIQSVTISGGLSVLKPDDDADSLLSRVDAYLYDAKSAGRNMVRSDKNN